MFKLIAAENKWPIIIVFFAVYAGFSGGGNDDLIQAVTSAPIATAISLLILRRGRAAISLSIPAPGTGPTMEETAATAGAYTISQLLPRGELICCE